MALTWTGAAPSSRDPMFLPSGGHMEAHMPVFGVEHLVVFFLIRKAAQPHCRRSGTHEGQRGEPRRERRAAAHPHLGVLPAGLHWAVCSLLNTERQRFILRLGNSHLSSKGSGQSSRVLSPVSPGPTPHRTPPPRRAVRTGSGAQGHRVPTQSLLPPFMATLLRRLPD